MFLNEIEDFVNNLLSYFRANGHFWLFCDRFSIVLYVNFLFLDK